MREQRPIGDLSLSELAALVEAAERPFQFAEETAVIQYADGLVRRSHDRLTELVVAARAEGVPWQAIGDALGVSRQGAFKRFGGAVEASHERKEMPEPTLDLIERTHAVFENLNADDYEAVRADMTYTCGRSLSKRKMMGVWKQVVTATGRLEACVDSTVRTPDGTSALSKFANRHLINGAIVQTTLRHEAGEWIGRVAYNGSGKITGVLIAPPGSRDLSF